jgi:hypothetical protein
MPILPTDAGRPITPSDDASVPFSVGRIGKLASNVYSSCVLMKDDGSLYCMGMVSGGGQLRTVAPSDHSCVGFNVSSAFGTANLERLPVEPLDDVAGSERTRCGILRKDKSVVCWGRNFVGELGHAPGTSGDELCDDAPCRTSPTPVPLPTASFVQIEAGLGHFCARTMEGSVYCWGWNDNAQVGKISTGPAPRIESPAKVDLDTNSAALLASGPLETCALVKSGANPGVYCWGLTRGVAPWTTAGGDANVAPTLIPGTATIAAQIRELAVGIGGGCALFNASARKPWCWGSTATGLLAGSAGDAGPGFNPGREIAELPGEARDVGLGSAGFALLSGGAGVTWGKDSNAELALAADPDAGAAPSARASLRGLTKLRLAPNQALAIKGTELVAWGQNECGELGHAPNTAQDTLCGSTPTPCNGAPQVVPLP